MPTYPIGQNATTTRDGEVNVANVAYTATPTVYGSGGAATGAFPVLLPQTSALNGAPIWTLLASGVSTGALPACPAMSPSYNAPRVTVRMT